MSEDRVLNILSIDGGGIRGIIPAVVLRVLEEKLKRRDASATLASTFDLLAGTSTGGIIVSALLTPGEHGGPRWRAADALKLYTTHGADIFGHRRRLNPGAIRDERYDARPLEELLQRKLGADTLLSQALKPCLITAYDIEDRQARFFTSHTAKKQPSQDYRLWEVARATSAAPTYFECARIHTRSTVVGVPRTCVDGGLFANNPAMCAFAEARKYLRRSRDDEPPSVQDVAILSLGTGTARTPYPYDDAKDWGAVSWVGPLIDIMMTGVSETVHVQLERLFDAAGAKSQYQRLQADLSREPEGTDELDNVSDENVRRLQEIGQDLADEHDDELELWADRLTGREERGTTVA